MVALAEIERRSSSPLPLAAIACPVSVSWPRTGYGNKAYTGREWDPETNLYYYRARYYDSRLGRFLSLDPRGFQEGMNFYLYVENTPTNATDPSGLAIVLPSCKGNKKKVEAAAAKADAASQTCLPCKERQRFRDVIRNDIVIDCVQSPISAWTGQEVCAETFAGVIRLTPLGMGEGAQCGCLQGTILHEVLHNLGQQHNAADAAGNISRFKEELKCFKCAK